MVPRRNPRPPSPPRHILGRSGRFTGLPENIPASRWQGFWQRCQSVPLPTPRQLSLAGLAVAGALLGSTLLGLIWPEHDRSEKLTAVETPASLALKPQRPITVLVIGTDAEGVGAQSKGAAPPGPVNSDALVLLRVNPRGPLQVLNLPTELAVQLPGETMPARLGDLYTRGGVLLTAEAVRELVGLEPARPDRYLVMPRATLRQLVNDIGGLELDPPRTMKYRDKAQNYTINLESGLQKLAGAQVEQLTRFRDKWLGEAGRRANHQLVETGLIREYARPEQLARLPGLLRRLEGKVETNLTGEEMLSLLAVGLDQSQPAQFASLSLAPEKEGHKGLRQLKDLSTEHLWKAP